MQRYCYFIPFAYNKYIMASESDFIGNNTEDSVFAESSEGDLNPLTLQEIEQAIQWLREQAGHSAEAVILAFDPEIDHHEVLDAMEEDAPDDDDESDAMEWAA